MCIDEVLDTGLKLGLVLNVEFRIGKRKSFNVVMTEEKELFAKQSVSDGSYFLCNEFKQYERVGQ